MKTYNITEGEGKLLIHMAADNSNYTVSYDHGSLIFEKEDRKYVVPGTNAEDIYFKRPDPNTAQRKYKYTNMRSLYIDTLPTDFGLSNVVDAEPNGSYFTEEITIGGVNEKISVIAPVGVIIYVNGGVVSSGTLVDNGDVVKFELTASGNYETLTNYNLSVGDITKSINITTRFHGIDTLDFFQDGSGVALYKLDGNGNDVGGNYHLSDISGSSSYTTGKFGQGRYVAGNNVMSNSVVGQQMTGNATISLWIYPSSSANTSWTNIFNFTNSSSNGSWVWGDWYHGGQNGSLHPHYGGNTGISVTSGKMNLNQWNHVVRVQKDGVHYVYINGVLTDSFTRANVSTMINFQLNHSSWTSGSPVGVDQVRLINRDITAQEVIELMNEN
jgi:hypothetical protein